MIIRTTNLNFAKFVLIIFLFNIEGKYRLKELDELSLDNYDYYLGEMANTKDTIKS